jgi:HD-GYP domain-containing protein (c-di-GMP phosphodiesterase class II)
MHWNASTLISLFATLIFGAIFGLVAFTKPHNRLRRIFGFYLLAMVSWSISALLCTSGLVEVLPWFKMMAASPIAMMLAIFMFVQEVFGIRRKWAPLTYLYAGIAIALALFTNLVVRSASLNPLGELQYELGIYIIPIAGPGYSLIIVSLVDLIRGYRSSQDANQRSRLRYLVLGLAITILSSLANFTPLGKYPIDVAANGITAILIAYAILRHQLLEIQVVIRFGLLYSLTTAVFGSIYYLSISLVLNFFQLLAGKELFIISILIGALSALVLTPLRNQAQKWVDRLFYRDKYNAGLMLQRLSQTTTSVLNLDEITRLILSEIINTLHIENGAILIRGNKDSVYRVIAQNKPGLELGFNADHPIVKWLLQKNGILTRHDLSIVPTFKSLWGEERKQLEQFKAELFIPLTAKGDLVGFIILGPKLSTQPYSHEDQIFLSTLANQTAVAVENARLYDELEDTFVQTVVALANAIDLRDEYTSTHSQQIATWAARTAQLLNCSPEMVKSVYWGGLLHDIGKIGVPDGILRKSSQLDADEWSIIHQHPRRGAEIITPIKKLSHVAPIIACSHERYDGKGYPAGITGEDIPLGARIIAVVDSFSAMIDERPYKKPFGMQKAVDELTSNMGKMYDPAVVSAFLGVLQDKESHLPGLAGKSWPLVQDQPTPELGKAGL